MATLKLTKTSVEAVSPGVKDIYCWDAQLSRFGLRVTPSGSRIYLIQYRSRAVAGEPPKTRRITIGHHGKPWTVDQARSEAKRLLAQVDLAGDPFAAREADRFARRAAIDAAEVEALRLADRQRDTFRAVAERFIDLRAKRNRSWQETERLLRHGPVAQWGERHIGDIRRADVADLIDSITKRSPAIARATFAAVRPLFSWCLERDLITTSPCEGLRAPPRPKSRERVLTDEEIKLAWQGSDRLSGLFGPLVKLLILTGQRRAEVAGMTWAELDLDAGIWRLPGDRTKNGRDHEVDLSDQALAVIADIPKTGPHLFPARGEGAARGFSATKRQLNRRVREAGEAELDTGEEAEELPDASTWRLHDLRRTAATGMAALGVAPHVVERVLNHVSGSQGGLVGVYQRHEYRTERKAALAAWGSKVEAIVSGREEPNNVTPLPVRRLS
ncbi:MULTISPECIES: site-specific integrase [unclassified Brevundimonas]|uniref:tyrosine-type recombinase/integrase n=1 Tax=unclassified Brevundimonas TaxID=2622653 RepID=UPI000CFE2DB3|nr:MULTISPECIES: site-specific integrase [unclassified Brevundimonas]PRA36665.1 integrase [Brevundimonas sp. MYb27]PQZ79474.1 integrase [Brevundimonas sp. MYb31]PRB13004.1 integrase [Brevundimonas sp. MYb52]PRB33638.1 integrase [Brevundimonas sp. MYb46]PRB48914.1 integrase [Brevundimonas sp. MYb33]